MMPSYLSTFQRREIVEHLLAEMANRIERCIPGMVDDAAVDSIINDEAERIANLLLAECEQG